MILYQRKAALFLLFIVFSYQSILAPYYAFSDYKFYWKNECILFEIYMKGLSKEMKILVKVGLRKLIFCKLNGR